MSSDIYPLLVVFGLDYTLWPFWVDSEFQYPPPYSKNSSSGLVVDKNGDTVPYFEVVPKIFELLKEKEVKIAVTSMTREENATRQLLKLLGWDKYIAYTEIKFGPSKVPLFQKLQKESSIDYSDMLFYDDSLKNAREVGPLGVMTIYMRKGELTMQDFEEGLTHFRNEKTDFTLWPFSVSNGTHYLYEPPYSRNKFGMVVDKTEKLIPYNEKVRIILNMLRMRRVQIGVISTSQEANTTQELLHLFGWNVCIQYTQIDHQHSTKAEMLTRIMRESGINGYDILFFDGLLDDILELERISVTSIPLKNDAITLEEFSAGLAHYRNCRTAKSGK